MRKIWLLVAASMLLLLLATGMAQSPARKFIVDPGPVVFDIDPNHPAAAPSMVTGSVMLKRSPDGVDSGTPTYKAGGGCLTYLASPTQACSDQSPCTKGYCGDTTGGRRHAGSSRSAIPALEGPILVIHCRRMSTSSSIIQHPSILTAFLSARFFGAW